LTSDQNLRDSINAMMTPSLFHLGANGLWTGVTFNILGFGENSTAQFYGPLTASVAINTWNGNWGPDTWAPVVAACGLPGSSGESNSLSLVGWCCPTGTGISFTESNQIGATAGFCPLTWGGVIQLMQ
jgi:hypothetical protein